MTMTITPAHSLAKKALIAATIAAGASFSPVACAAQASATASGTVVAPIAITAVSQLAFGSFAPGPGGTVTVDTGGARSAVGAILVGSAPVTAARFHITGQAGLTYSIVHGGSTQLNNGAASMTLTKFSDLAGVNGVSGNVSSGVLDGAGSQSLFVGGTLAVAANQTPGLYSGTVIASVEYN